MAKDKQIAVCVSVDTVKVQGENKEVYTLNLDGNEFQLWQSKYFTAKKDEKFTPFLSVIAKAYLSKDGKPRVRNSVFVNWEKI